MEEQVFLFQSHITFDHPIHALFVENLDVIISAQYNWSSFFFEPVVLDPAGLNVWPVDLGSHLCDAEGNFQHEFTLRWILRSIKKLRQNCVQI